MWKQQLIKVIWKSLLIGIVNMEHSPWKKKISKLTDTYLIVDIFNLEVIFEGKNIEVFLIIDNNFEL